MELILSHPGAVILCILVAMVVWVVAVPAQPAARHAVQRHRTWGETARMLNTDLHTGLRPGDRGYDINDDGRTDRWNG